jgi:hypothetical protein
VKRREFIGLLGGALAAQAIPANAQELRVRTVGVLMGLANDAEAKARVKTFEQGLEREGWSVGQNLRIEYRYNGKLGLGVRSRNLWSGHWWIHVRYCSAHCEARHELERREHQISLVHTFLSRISPQN